MLSNLESAYSVCEQITQRSAKNFFYAFRVLPKEKRSAIYVVYAFCRMCDDIADGTLPNQAKFDKLEEIAKLKMKDLNANNLDGAVQMIKGSAKSMGLEIVE